MVVFFVKINENTNPKGRALMQMYRVVPKTKRGNSRWNPVFTIMYFAVVLGWWWGFASYSKTP